jgi:hypothetical protein
LSIDLKPSVLTPDNRTADVLSPWVLRWALIIIVIMIGFAGVLLDGRDKDVVVQIIFPLGFSVSLSMAVASLFFTPLLRRVPALDPVDYSLRVRYASRCIYLLLYVLAATKEIQFFCQNAAAGRTLSEAMCDLQPYLGGALFALIFARVLARLTTK